MLEEAKLLDEDYENGKQRSWGTNMTVDGVSYATSLFWQPLQNKDDPFNEVEEASEGILEGADLFCIKPGKAPQFGICVSSEGYKKGDNVAAVTLAMALSDRSSFVSVFKVDNGWWYTCIRNDIILSDGDMLFLSEQEAKEQFMSMLAVPDWGRKIAPPEWGIDETEYPDLTQILNKGLKAKLQKIKALRGTKLLIVVLISAIIGLWLLSSIINGIFLAPPTRPIIAPIPPKVVEEIEVPPEIKPWEQVNRPNDVMKWCYYGVEALKKILPPGWTINNLTCTPEGITTSWKRDIGRVSWVNKALDDSGLIFSSRSVSDDGENIIASVPLGKVDVISSPPMKSDEDLKLLLNDLFQAIGQKVALTSFSYVSPQNNVYRSVQFKFSSNHNPLEWMDLLTKFSGLTINMINYNVGNDIWDYEGAIYVL